MPACTVRCGATVSRGVPDLDITAPIEYGQRDGQVKLIFVAGYIPR